MQSNQLRHMAAIHEQREPTQTKQFRYAKACGCKFVILSRDKTCRNKTNSFEYSIINNDGPTKNFRDRFNEKKY